VFTGIIEETGVIVGMRTAGSGVTLEIGAYKVLAGTRTGDSISVDGVCLTVERLSEKSFFAFISKVSLSITSLAGRKKGDRVNLERALLPGSRMGGHFVQGHVDGTGRIKAMSRDSAGLAIEIGAAEAVVKYIVPRGSVAVDGISLTAVSVAGDGFSLYLIPETVSHTTLAHKKAGDLVNIETDILGKYVERFLGLRSAEERGAKDGALLSKLMEEGYL